MIKYIGIDKIINNIVQRLGNPENVWLVGDFARGINSNIISLKISGNIDKLYLDELINKIESSISRKINIKLIDTSEDILLENKSEPSLLLWSKE